MGQEGIAPTRAKSSGFTDRRAYFNALLPHMAGGERLERPLAESKSAVLTSYTNPQYRPDTPRAWTIKAVMARGLCNHKLCYSNQYVLLHLIHRTIRV